MCWLRVAQEVKEAYAEARRALGSVKPAELERRLKMKSWSFIQPLSVGDDLSIVLKLDFKQPDRSLVEGLAASLGLGTTSMRLFDYVLVAEGRGYLGIGRGLLRISPKLPSEVLDRVLETLLSRGCGRSVEDSKAF